MAFLLVLGLMVIVGQVSGNSTSVTTTSPEYCDWPSSAGTKPTKWREEQIPNPRIDVCKCGRYGKKSWVCDPNNVISSREADEIDAEIEKLRSNTGGCHCEKKCERIAGYHGYQAGVVILQAMYTKKSSPSASDKRKTADDITDYLRDDDWEFGLCDDDLVILVSDKDRFVYTATGDEIAGIVTDSCVEKITANSKVYLSNKEYGKAVKNMIQEYTLALNHEHSCNKKMSAATTGIIVGVLALLVGGGVGFVCLRRRCCPDFCNQSGYGSPEHDSKGAHFTKTRSRSNSASSQSSGGGGGGF